MRKFFLFCLGILLFIGIIGQASALTITNSSLETVPEPATMFLFGLGLIGIAGVSKKKATKINISKKMWAASAMALPFYFITEKMLIR